MATYPGNYAVPGLMWPGFVLPAQPTTGTAGGAWKFTGNYPVEYPQYLDATAMTTLTAAPGGRYFITPVGGDPGISPIPGDGRWIPA